MNHTQQETWVQHQPYTAMLRQYNDAADRLKERLQTLKDELKEMQERGQDSAESAFAQRILERRMDLLRTEYYELTDCIRDIAFYAERENH